MALTDKRVNLKPYEYPEFLRFKDAIRQSYWIHDEFNFSGDVQDFHEASDEAQQVVKRTILAIAQIEVAVKLFWGNVYNHFPKPEVAAVGATFSDSEARHLDAYSHLLEKLGLNEDFAAISDIPAIQGRMEYLDKYTSCDDFVYEVLLFSLFVEHVSLFGQFLILMSFDKHEKRFSGLANVVEATSKEEEVHGLFGAALVNRMREEGLFDLSQYREELTSRAMQAYRAEEKIVDWIFDSVDEIPGVISSDEVKRFIQDKFNRSLSLIDVAPLFDVESSNQWFYDEVVTTKDNDFFAKRSTTYSKGTSSVTGDDLF